MIDVILYFYKQAADSLRFDTDIRDVEAAGVKDAIARMKYIPQEELAKIDRIKKEIEKQFLKLLEKPQLEE
jgi:hypothetical protein